MFSTILSPLLEARTQRSVLRPVQLWKAVPGQIWVLRLGILLEICTMPVRRAEVINIRSPHPLPAVDPNLIDDNGLKLSFGSYWNGIYQVGLWPDVNNQASVSRWLVAIERYLFSHYFYIRTSLKLILPVYCHKSFPRGLVTTHAASFTSRQQWKSLRRSLYLQTKKLALLLLLLL